MIRIFLLILFFFLNYSCSLNSHSTFWTKTEKVKKEKNSQVQEIFKKEDALKSEINPYIRIILKENYSNNSFLNNLTNNNGNIKFDGNLKKISKYKFSKIEQFEFNQPELLFTESKNIIFFDKKGAILKFNDQSKLIWKKNYYSKSEKKLNPILYFAGTNDKLIVTDNIAKYYSLDINTGEMLWSKKNSSPFNSQIKIYKNVFFTVDFENVLRCFSIKDGKELWQFKTDRPFIKSQQKLSIIIHENKVIFVNTLGDVSAIDIANGNLIWQTPTQTNLVYAYSFSLKNSDLVLKNNSIYFSNNRNEFFSIDVKTGIINWKQKINSNLRPTIIENLIFSVSLEGYLVLVSSENGQIVRMTNVFDRFKNKKGEIKPTGFVVSKDKIYLSLNNGRMIIINVEDGKSKEIIKISSNKISRPYILDKSMFLVSNKSIQKIN